MSITRKVANLAGAAALAIAISGCSKAPVEEEAAAEQGVFVPPIDIDVDNFIEGNLYFTAYHELGHAFVSEYDLPIAGREEDAVDRLAVWLMTPVDDSPPDYLFGAIRGWFMTGAEIPLDEIAWWDEHGSDGQRGYQIACLLYGTDTQKYKDVAAVVELPEERAEKCEWEAGDNARVWDRFLSDYVRPDNDAAPKEDVTITYGETKDYADDKAYLAELGLMDEIARMMTEGYRFEPGIKLEARECGEANAYWSSDDRTLTFCYEEVATYRALADKLKPPAS